MATARKSCFRLSGRLDLYQKQAMLQIIRQVMSQVIPQTMSQVILQAIQHVNILFHIFKLLRKFSRVFFSVFFRKIKVHTTSVFHSY